jgi:phosphoglycerate dehydrogenase-like enzyme
MHVLILSKICEKAVSRLEEKYHAVRAIGMARAQLLEIVSDYDVLVFRSGVAIDRELLERAKTLKLIVRAGSGMDNLDVGYAEQNNIIIKRIPEPAASAVAEMAFGLMLCLARKILIADKAFRQGAWIKNDIEGRLLMGKVLGVVGVGSIGSSVGQLGRAMGMRVVGCVENPNQERAESLGRLGIELLSLADVITQADSLCLHVPLKESTRNLIDRSVLSSMKEGSFLVDLSRGGVVDEQALFEALTSGGGLAGAAIDVHQSEGPGFTSPFLSLPNVILTPHIGSQTIDTQVEIGKRVVELIDELSGGKC